MFSSVLGRNRPNNTKYALKIPHTGDKASLNRCGL